MEENSVTDVSATTGGSCDEIVGEVTTCSASWSKYHNNIPSAREDSAENEQNGEKMVQKIK